MSSATYGTLVEKYENYKTRNNEMQVHLLYYIIEYIRRMDLKYSDIVEKYTSQNKIDKSLSVSINLLVKSKLKFYY